MYAGMVGWAAVPSCPIAVASPATLFTTTTPTAPAVCALRIFVENVQAPREINAILPVRLPAGSAEQAVLSAPLLSTTPSGAVRFDETLAKAPDTPA